VLDLSGYEIANQEMLQSGCFHKRRVWVKGWHRFPANVAWMHIHGLTGQETYIVEECIYPVVTFVVVDEIAIKNAA